MRKRATASTTSVKILESEMNFIIYVECRINLIRYSPEYCLRAISLIAVYVEKLFALRLQMVIWMLEENLFWVKVIRNITYFLGARIDCDLIWPCSPHRTSDSTKPFFAFNIFIGLRNNIFEASKKRRRN